MVDYYGTSDFYIGLIRAYVYLHYAGKNMLKFFNFSCE